MVDSWLNSYPRGQKGRLFADDILRCIFVNEIYNILIKISLKVVSKGPTGNDPALVLAWLRIGDKPLSEPILTRFTDAYVRHYLEMSKSNLRYINILHFNLKSITLNTKQLGQNRHLLRDQTFSRWLHSPGTKFRLSQWSWNYAPLNLYVEILYSATILRTPYWLTWCDVSSWRHVG